VFKRGIINQTDYLAVVTYFTQELPVFSSKGVKLTTRQLKICT